jgi:hypothetical protein
VVAQIGTRLADGSLIHVTDSPAVQIIARVTDSRSINAMNALIDAPSGADAAVSDLVKEAAILTGLGSGRPTLQTTMTPSPALQMADVADATGAYRRGGAMQGGTELDLSLAYPDAIAASASPGVWFTGSALTALLLLDGSAIGSFQRAGDLTAQVQAIRAYSIAKGF